MNQRRVSGDSALDDAAMPFAGQATTMTICPACGYPTLNPGLCAYCRPSLAL